MAGRVVWVGGIATVLLLAMGQAPAETGSTDVPTTLEAVLEPYEVVVRLGAEVVTAYRFAPDQKYPYFWPVNGPKSSKSVTTESSEPYPHHHSLFFGCDRVNGGNFWQEGIDKGQIVSQGPVIQTSSGPEVVFTDECLWRVPGQDPVIRDRRRIAVSAPRDGLWYIDFEIELEPLVDVVIEKTNHSLFSARMVPELGVERGGRLVNAEGGEGEAGTFGVPSPWCDYYGTRDGVTEGLAIFQHPSNPGYPAPWFTRDYGFFSPTPMYWLENDRLALPKGDNLTLRYRVVVHSDTTDEAGMAGLFQDYARTVPPPPRRRNDAQ
jgi:hypothetical protein